MRIAYLAPFDLEQPAGHAAHVTGTLRQMVARDEQVTLYALGCPADVASGLEFRRVPTLRRAGLTALGFGAAAAALLARDLGHIDVVYTRYFKSVALPLAVTRAFGRPSVVEVNAGLGNERRVGGVGALARRLEQSEESLVMRLASSVVVVTEAIKRELHRKYRLSVPIVVVENGVDTELYRPLDRESCRRELRLLPRARYAIFTGALQPWQGIGDLLTALQLARREQPELRLLIVGDGPERVAAVELTQRLGLTPFVTFTGFISEAEVVKYVAAADVCVAPYDTRAVDDDEPDKRRYGAPMPRSPLKLLSYMACGRPTIATHLAEAGAYLQSQGAGVAVPPEDPSKLAAALLALLSDSERSRRLGEQARRVAEASHGWEIAVGRYLDVARNAIERSAGRI